MQKPFILYFTYSALRLLYFDAKSFYGIEETNSSTVIQCLKIIKNMDVEGREYFL